MCQSIRSIGRRKLQKEAMGEEYLLKEQHPSKIPEDKREGEAKEKPGLSISWSLLAYHAVAADVSYPK